MPIDRVTSGQPVIPELKHQPWNAFVDAANAHQLPKKPGSTIVVQDNAETPTCSVKVNATSTAIEYRGVSGLISPALAPTDQMWRGRMLFGQSAPTMGAFALAQREGPVGYFVEADALGIVQCKLFVPTDGDWIARADVDTDATRLRAQPNGSAQILWKDTGTNTTVDAIVRIGNPQNVQLTAVADGVIPAGGTGNVKVWQSGADTNFPITGVELQWMDGGQDISSGKEVLICWFPFENVWRVIGAECEDPPEPVLGQMASAVVGGTQAVTTTAAAINDFDASENFNTPNVTINAGAAEIVIPEPAVDTLYSTDVTVSGSASANNSVVYLDQYVNGVFAGEIGGAEAKQADTTITITGSRYTTIGAIGSTIPVSFRIRGNKSFTFTYGNSIASITKWAEA